MGLGQAAAQVVRGDPPSGVGRDPPGLQLRGGLKGRAGVPGRGTVRQAGGMADTLTLMAVHAHPDDEASSTGGVLARKQAALLAHASQISESWLSQIPPEVGERVFGEESFVRVMDSTGAPLPEDDLFAGLR